MVLEISFDIQVFKWEILGKFVTSPSYSTSCINPCMRRSWGKEPFPLSQISSRLPGQVTARDNQLIIAFFVSFLKQNMDYLHIITQSTYFCSDQPLKYLGVLRNICKNRNFGKIRWVKINLQGHIFAKFNVLQKK